MARGERRSRDELDELSRLFLDLRERAGLSQPEAAEAAGITQSMLSRAETGRGVPNPEVTAGLARIYHATAAERQRLCDLASVMKPARMDSRLIMQRGRNLTFQARIAEMERSSILVRAYQPHMMVGAVQTPRYALAVFIAGAARSSAPLDSDPAAELAAARAERFRLLTEDRERDWVLVMSEAALHWHAGSPAVMIEQLAQIATATRLPHVRLGIIPLRTPARIFAPHGFDIYDSRGVCIGTRTATALTTDASDIADYEQLFGELERMTVFDDACREIAEQIANEYRRLI
jgi:transcriptional regulator with XRE-family HTH domain